MEVAEERRAKALAVVESHATAVQARGFGYCVCDVFEWDKKEVDRWRLEDEVKVDLRSALDGVSTVLVVLFMCADEEPEAFSGGGPEFHFILHPRTFHILHVSEGTWRS